MSRYRKAVAAGAGVLGVLASVAQDGEITAAEWRTVGLAALSAIGVFLFPNTDPED